jgi:outer membrane protein TolC
MGQEVTCLQQPLHFRRLARASLLTVVLAAPVMWAQERVTMPAMIAPVPAAAFLPTTPVLPNTRPTTPVLPATPVLPGGTLTSPTLPAAPLVSASPVPAASMAPAAPVAPAVPAAPAPLTLDDCVRIAFEKQPALAAARASLAAAIDAQAALDNLPPFARLCNPDLCLRKEQAGIRVTIAQAAVTQTEWETRYAVTHHYFTHLYMRLQLLSADVAVQDLKTSEEIINILLKVDELRNKTSKDDLDINELKIRYVNAVQAEIRAGLERSLAALREAMGVAPDFPLELAALALPADLQDSNNLGVNELSRLAAIDVTLAPDVLVKLALSRRAEIVQASAAGHVTDLEISAQAAKSHSYKVGTFAGAADIHAGPTPQVPAESKYPTRVLSIEMPALFVGRACDRVARASDLNQRALAVVDQTRNLIVDEAEDGYQRWRETRDKVRQYDEAAINLADALHSKRAEKLRGKANLDKYGGRDLIDLVMQKYEYRARYFEMRYQYVLSLAALERITGGGLRIYPARHP